MYHQSNIYVADRQQKQLEEQQSLVQQLQRELAVKRILVSKVNNPDSFTLYACLLKVYDNIS